MNVWARDYTQTGPFNNVLDNHVTTILAGDWKSRSLPRHVDKLDTFTAYSSADEEGHAQNVGGRLGGRSTRETARLRSREEKPRGRQRLSERGSDSGERWVKNYSLIVTLMVNLGQIGVAIFIYKISKTLTPAFFVFLAGLGQAGWLFTPALMNQLTVM